jgi:hypothetical protein
LILRNGAEDAELGVQVFADIHDGCNIATAIAVVRSRPDGNHRLLREVILEEVSIGLSSRRRSSYLVTLIDQLMSASNELQSIYMVELSCNLITKEPAGAAWRNGPSFNIFRVTPDEITESTLMRDLLSTCNDTNLVNGADFRAETTVNA